MGLVRKAGKWKNKYEIIRTRWSDFGRVSANFEKAKKYVGSPGDEYFYSGEAQFYLLVDTGCVPASHVLEIGCGALASGRLTIDYLEPDHYVGLEPNKWLIDAFIEGVPQANHLINNKRPVFLNNAEFDASETNRQFDFIISHSILSHVADWQLPLFLQNTQKCLSENGIILASIRMTDEKGNSMEDSHDNTWQYGGKVSFFSWETVQSEASKAGLSVEWKTEYKDIFTKKMPRHYHDWIILKHKNENG